jgi:ADP-ribose pyrophosphatase YjhB (NUDIX family)
MNDIQTQPYWYVVNVEAAILKEAHYLMIVRGHEESHAPGVLTLVGGKVENAGSADDILERTLHREVREETGIEIQDDVEYVESKAFIADDGEPVIDIVFLCRYASGSPAIADPGEVAAVQWMTPEQVLAHPLTPPWTRQSIERAEKARLARGW